MIRVFNPNEPLNTPTSVALGTFDGLHVGHMAIINKLREEGHYRKCVFTFSNSPVSVAAKVDIKYVVSQEEKANLLEKSGVDYLLTTEFNEEIMSLTAEEFFDKYIVNILDAKEIFVGYNYTFGKNKSGTTQVLKELCDKHGITLNVMPPVFVEDEPVSSTRIRKEVASGNVALAGKLLGRNITVDGTVVEGNKLGRTMGFPTVNIAVDNGRALPPDGVYAAKTVIHGAAYRCIANLGARPTVSDKGERLFEAHVADFEGDLYGQYMTFELVEKMRDICKFDSVDSLKNQLEKDIKEINKINL